jgi:hypothetical protein
MSENEEALLEADESRHAANAALSGIDIETARRMGDRLP